MEDVKILSEQGNDILAPVESVLEQVPFRTLDDERESLDGSAGPSLVMCQKTQRGSHERVRRVEAGKVTQEVKVWTHIWVVEKQQVKIPLDRNAITV